MISEPCTLGLSDDELSSWHDEDLSPARMAQLRTHIATCAVCQRRVAAYEEIGRGLRSLTPPPLDVERLMADVRAAMPAATPASPTPTATGRALMPERHSWRSWRRVSGAAGLAAVVVISLLAGYLFVSHGRPAPAKVSAPPLTGADLPIASAVIDMSSATDGWAFTSKSLNGDAPVVALHYSAGKWTRVQTVVQGEIRTLKMLSPTDGWLLGTRIYHYDGHSWQIVAVPGPGWRLDMRYDALTALAPSSIWISTEGTDVDPGPSMLHYDGNTWTRQALPMPDWLQHSSYTVQGISMASNDEGWAIASSSVEGGSAGEPLGVLLHYTHGAWTIDGTYIGVRFDTVSLTSVTDGWIGGAYVTTTSTGNGGYDETDRPLLWRLSNGHWRIQPIPGGYKPPLFGQILSIRMLSPTTGWMMAEIGPADASGTDSYPLFQLRNDQWVRVPDTVIPDDISQYFATAFVSADEFWAVGRSGISHYASGQWKLVVP